jgi:hypothetical protein
MARISGFFHGIFRGDSENSRIEAHNVIRRMSADLPLRPPNLTHAIRPGSVEFVSIAPAFDETCRAPGKFAC